MIDTDTREEIQSFYESDKWEHREWELEDGVHLVIDWSLEGYREPPYLMVYPDEADWYESPDEYTNAADHSGNIEDLIHELDDVLSYHAEIHNPDDGPPDLWS